MPTLYYKNNNVWEQLNLLTNLSGSDLQNLRKEMGLGDTLGVLPIENGGTGATSIVDNTQLYNYLTGDGVSSLTGNEPVFVKNLEELSEIFNVAGKQVLSVKWQYNHLSWAASGITSTNRSVAGFDTPSYSVHTNNHSNPYYNNSVMTSKCQKSGTYQIDITCDFYQTSGTASDTMRRQFIVTLGSNVVNVVNDSSYMSFIGSHSSSYNELVNLNANDTIKVEAGWYTKPYAQRTVVDMKITRVS